MAREGRLEGEIVYVASTSYLLSLPLVPNLLFLESFRSRIVKEFLFANSLPTFRSFLPHNYSTVDVRPSEDRSRQKKTEENERRRT